MTRRRSRTRMPRSTARSSRTCAGGLHPSQPPREFNTPLLKRAGQSWYIIRAKNPENQDFGTRNNVNFEAVFDRKINLGGTTLGFSGGFGGF